MLNTCSCLCFCTWIIWFEVVSIWKTSWCSNTCFMLFPVSLSGEGKLHKWCPQTDTQLCSRLCIDLKCACVVSCFLRYVQGLGRLFVCWWKLRAEEATSSRQMHFQGVWPLHWDPEKGISILPYSALLRNKNWFDSQRACSMCKVGHVECMGPFTRTLPPSATPCLQSLLITICQVFPV